MNLKKYDEKLVRISCIDGKDYEGICYYNSNEYNYHEYGVDEDGLQIACFLFYKSDIKKVVLLDNFSDKYGLIEKEAFEDGIDLIEEIFEREEDEHIYRMLLYIKDHLSNCNVEKDKLIKLLDILIKYNEDERVIKESKNIKNKLIKED